MNSVHDMGGMHGMGPVVIEKDEPVFHAEWEARAWALTVAAASHRQWNIDMGRYSRERMPPADYLAATYYERWLFGLQKLLVEVGLTDALPDHQRLATAAQRRGARGGADRE